MAEKWTLDSIKEGFERFISENGRLPIAPEIDKLDYLPSSRQIQRRFGGLEKLRADLGYSETHFGRGNFRSEITTRINIRGRRTEIELEEILKQKFGEIFVHTEKIFDDSKNRVDFYIYSPSGNFGIDVFYTETMRDLQKNINLKIDKYHNFPCQLFFVVGNDVFNQADLDECIVQKSKFLPSNIRLLTLKSIVDFIESKDNYPDPLKL